MEDTPNLVLTITVALLIIAVGLFVIVTFVGNVGIPSDSTEEFAVSDPSVDFTCTLKYKPSAEPSVSQYNGIQWVSVSDTFVSYNNRELTVLAGGMQG